MEHPQLSVELINFLIENNIYCHVSCEYEGQESSVISVEEIEKLESNGLLVDNELAIEAIILSNPDKSYDNLDAIEKTKEEVDNILKNSWWLYKFEI